MSFHFSKDKLNSDYNITIDINKQIIELKDLKINGKYIDKIYWCDQNLFTNFKDNCALVYKRKNINYQVLLSGYVYDILTNQQINNVHLTFQRAHTRNPKTLQTYTYSLSRYNNGYYQISGIISNSTYNLIASKKHYSTYTQNDFSIKGTDLTKDIYINPIDNSVSRIILNWDLLPLDLDLYVICPNGQQLSVRNNKSVYGYVNYTDNQSTGPQIITLNSYVDFSSNLKVGGDFQIYTYWNSDDETTKMNSTISIFTEQFGKKTFSNTSDTDNKKRHTGLWEVGKLSIKSNIDSIQINNSDLISYQTKLDLDILNKLGSVFKDTEYRYNNYVYGLIYIKQTYNKYSICQNGILYLLKNYPFIVEVIYNNIIINNYTKIIYDNITQKNYDNYKAYLKLENLEQYKNKTIKINLYLNEQMKQKNSIYYSNNYTVNSAGYVEINFKNIFENKYIPIICYTKQHQFINNLMYRYEYNLDTYIIETKRRQNNKSLDQILKDGYIKFNLGLNKNIKIEDIKSSIQNFQNFNTLSSFVYHNHAQLNNYIISSNIDNTQLNIYGSLNHPKQRYFEINWLNNAITYQIDWQQNFQDDIYHEDDNYEYKNKFRNFYFNDHNWGEHGQFYSDNRNYFNNKRAVTYIEDKDQYKINILDYKHFISGYFIQNNDINIEYINVQKNNLTTDANNIYMFMQDLPGIQQQYILQSISSNINGQFQFTYYYDVNGINISFANKTPKNQFCILKFKRQYLTLDRNSINNMLQPKIIITQAISKKSLKYVYTWYQDNVVIDFIQQLSGYTNGYYANIIDFNKMYLLSTQFINQFKTSVEFNYTLNTLTDLKQDVQISLELWQNDQLKHVYNSFITVNNHEQDRNNKLTYTFYDIDAYKNYNIKLYTTYRQYYGDLSGMYYYNSDNLSESFSSFKRFYDYQYDHDYDYQHDYIEQYKNRQYIQQENILLNQTFNISQVSGKLTYSGYYPYGQFKGKIYDKNGKAFENNYNDYAILKHKTLDIKYYCNWNKNTIKCINYIYNGQYDFIVYYGGTIVYQNTYNITKNNILQTTNLQFITQKQFKTIKIGLYNIQSGKHVLTCQPNNQYLRWDDCNYEYGQSTYDGYDIYVYDKNKITDDNSINNITRNIYSSSDNKSKSAIKITDYGIDDNIYKVFISYYNNEKYLNINKIQQGNKDLKYYDFDNPSGNVIYFTTENLTDGQQIKIWVDYYYWYSFEAQLNTYTNQYRHNFYHNGIIPELSDMSGNIINFTFGNRYIYKTYQDMNEIVQNSIWGDYRYDIDQNVTDQTHFRWWLPENSNYQQTQQYNLKLKKIFNNPQNNPITFFNTTFNMYDSQYTFNKMPQSYPRTIIHFRAMYKKYQDTVGNISGCLNTNTLISIPIFCGTANSVNAFEYNIVQSLCYDMQSYPEWTDDYNHSGDKTDQIGIISQLKYWVGCFDMFKKGDASDNLLIYNIYEIDNQLVSANYISNEAIPIGETANYGTYAGYLINGNQFKHQKQYLIVLSESNDISIGGYIESKNNSELTNYTFDIYVYSDKNQSQLIIKKENINPNQFSLGIFKKGTYYLKLCFAGDNIDIIANEYKQQNWQTNLANICIAKTYFNIYTLNVNNYCLNNGNKENIKSNSSTILLQYIPNQNDKLSKYHNIYIGKYNTNNNNTFYQVIEGNYKIIQGYSLTNKNIKLSDLNIIDKKINLDANIYKDDLQQSYIQGLSNLTFGKLIDKNDKIVFFDQNNNIITNNYTDLNSTVSIEILQQTTAYNVNINGDITIQHIFDHTWGNGMTVSFNNFPGDINNKLILTSNDNIFDIIQNDLSLTINKKIKTYTTFNVFAYHDDIAIGNKQFTYLNNSQHINVEYNKSNLTVNFIDALTNNKIAKNIISFDDNCKIYHIGCSQQILSANIIANNQYLIQLDSDADDAVTFNNLIANQDYLVLCKLGKNQELSGTALINNISIGNRSIDIVYPYSFITLSPIFYDKNNNSNVQNSSYARLLLQRCQNDGYDETYEIYGNNYHHTIKTGNYNITLQSRMPNQPITYYRYQHIVFIDKNITMHNYINTNPTRISFKIYVNNVLYTQTNKIIKILLNSFIYSSKNVDSSGITSFDLFNIQYTVQLDTNINNIIAQHNSTFSINNNKFTFITQLRQQTFNIYL